MAATPHKGGVGSTKTAAKRKRVRKTKKRTTAAEEDSPSDSSSSDSDEGETNQIVARRNEEAIAGRRNGVKHDKVEVITKTSSSSSSSSSSDSSDSEEARTGDGKPEKRRRKRVRKTKSKTEEGANKGTELAAKPPVELETIRLLPDPRLDARLSEATMAALGYAKVYLLERPSWKFSKARQEHLIRHMLSRPISMSDGRVEQANKEAGEDKEHGVDEDDAPQASWWPDEWNGCVALYLATVQGAAKARLLQRLRDAAAQSVPEVPLPAAPKQETDTNGPSSEVQQNQQAKSVRFAEMAMTADERSTVDYTSKVSHREQILFERGRARALLSQMGEAIL